MHRSGYSRGPTWKAVFSYLKSGYIVIGIDEVGRGAWAGPVTAAAVILPPNLQIFGLNDSKLVTPARRLSLSKVIRRQALSIGLGWASPHEIDTHGLSWAVTQSGLRAIKSLPLTDAKYVVILDGRHVYLSDYHPSVAFVHADADITPVSAASIIAKVARDNYMRALAHKFPSYGYELHKGYGTKIHMHALNSLGPTVVHRKSVGPIDRRIVTA